jgi:hypothetical protein
MVLFQPAFSFCALLVEAFWVFRSLLSGFFLFIVEEQFNNAFPDVGQNPATFPVHQYHLGLWFNDPKVAAKAGCPGTVTPFNGEHNAGIQVLNTSNFPDLQGPLFHLKR